MSATWDTAGVVPRSHDWRIEAPGATPATGSLDTLAAGLSLAFTGASADPEVVAPGGAPALRASTVTYTLSAAANVTAVVLDAAGVEVAELAPPAWRRAGAHTIAFDGLGLPDGALRGAAARAGDGRAGGDAVGGRRRHPDARAASSCATPS